MMTAMDLQDFGYTWSMAYAFLKREDVPVNIIGKKKFICREKFYEWFEMQNFGDNEMNIKTTMFGLNFEKADH